MYNEEENVDIVVTQLMNVLNSCELISEWELIVVDDGSVDNTLQAVKKYAKEEARIRVFRHFTNLGLGKALETGFKQASKEIVVTIDADLSYDPKDIPKLILPLIQEPYVDIVVGSPYLGRGLVKNVQTYRIILSKFVNYLYRWITRSSLTCYTSIFRAYRANVVKDLRIKSRRFEAQPEILLKLIQRGCKVKEIPVVLRSREKGRSKVVLPREVALHIKLLVAFITKKIR